jgi:hypothetical protein
LINIHEYDDPEKDMADLVEELAEKDGEFAHIKGFGLIHGASKYFRLISEEIADSLNDSPGAHVGRNSWLIGEL